ncbi:hypothetical protein [Pyrobaculum ferrireducens]|uniref:Uncharacterized protein n=1 Tax=Pyrobaculum ferrireducens TaxID=1104324 RepID=G7VEX7_9CREN|nr:hypothetical protein [Pyrobaculum ferrireducens]AET34142.1 hypothetical protein P186_2765 [Pyrobaculum ferrireducens]
MKDQLDEVLKYYLLYGGTAWGIELTARCLSNEEPPHVAGPAVGGHHSDKRESKLCQEPPVAFFDTIDEILEDAREYGVRPEVVKAVLYSAAERVFEKGLEVGDKYEEVRNLAQDIANVKVETNDVETAIEYLRKSHILFTIRMKKLSKSPKEEGGRDSKSDSPFKIVFSDPRYALGAYMHYQHTLYGTTYVDAYYKVKDEIMGQLDKSAHYLESIFLANVALGVYALVTGHDRPDRGHLPDKFVKYLKNGWEIDAYVTIKRRDGPISFLAEFSINYDRSHVEKCSEAANRLNTYCIYAVYRGGEVRLEGKVLTTPLSLFFALL